MSTKAPEGALNMIAVGFSEDSRCLSFRVAFHDFEGRYEGAKAAVRIIDEYNEFEAEPICRTIDRIAAAKMIDYPGIEVGRELSPVMYLYADSIGNAERIVDELVDCHARPDELDIYPYRTDTKGAVVSYVVRAWWD